MLEYTDATFKMIGTTNPKFEKYCGAKGNLRYVVGLSAIFDMLEKFLSTSVVQSIEEKEDLVILNTLNSVYTFQRLT